jgi:hypothetical protein
MPLAIFFMASRISSYLIRFGIFFSFLHTLPQHHHLNFCWACSVLACGPGKNSPEMRGFLLEEAEQ